MKTEKSKYTVIEVEITQEALAKITELAKTYDIDASEYIEMIVEKL